MQQVPNAAMDWIKQNPGQALQGANSLSGMMDKPQPPQMPPSPILHGQMGQYDDSLLSLLPQTQRQPISLI